MHEPKREYICAGLAVNNLEYRTQVSALKTSVTKQVRLSNCPHSQTRRALGIAANLAGERVVIILSTAGRSQKRTHMTQSKHCTICSWLSRATGQHVMCEVRLFTSFGSGTGVLTGEGRGLGRGGKVTGVIL